MSNARTTIDIDPAPYVRSHMKQPRGYGGWAFAAEQNPRDVCKDSRLHAGHDVRGCQGPAVRYITMFAQP